MPLSIMPLLSSENAQERTVALDHNSAMPDFKPAVLEARLRASMVASALDVAVLYRLLRHSNTRWYVKCVLFLPVMYLCSPIQIDPKLYPRAWADGRCVRDLNHKKVRAQANRPEDLATCQNAATETGFSFFKASSKRQVTIAN